MQHVGVGDDPARTLADKAAGLGRGVAVVGGRRDVAELRYGVDEGDQRFELVLAECLRRREIQDGRPRGTGQIAERGKLIAQRFARRGARRHDDMLAGVRLLGDGDLMRVRDAEAGGDEVIPQGGKNPLRPLPESGCLRG